MTLERIARRQHGVVTARQAAEQGLSPSAVRWRMSSGRWQRLHTGVYLTHSGSPTWHAKASAAVLAVGPPVAVATTSAAFLWRIGRPVEPREVTIAVPRDRSVRRPSGVRVLRLARINSVVIEGLPVTTAAQTVIDITAAPECSVDDAVALMARACQLGRVTSGSLLEELRLRGRHPRRRALLLALIEVEGGVESVPELRFVRNVARAHGLPPFELQVVEGRVRRDFKNREYGVNVEVDGQLWHAGGRFHADRKRDRATTAKGEVNLRATWVDVELEPCALAVDIGLTLRQRGWSGQPRACSPQCPVSQLGTTR